MRATLKLEQSRDGPGEAACSAHGSTSAGPRVVLQDRAGLFCSIASVQALPLPSGTQVDPICSWTLFKSPDLALNCFYLLAPEGAREGAAEPEADGVGRLCVLSAEPVPPLCSLFRSHPNSSHNDLISPTAVFEFCATPGLSWTLCAPLPGSCGMGSGMAPLQRDAPALLREVKSSSALSVFRNNEEMHHSPFFSF